MKAKKPLTRAQTVHAENSRRVNAANARAFRASDIDAALRTLASLTPAERLKTTAHKNPKDAIGSGKLPLHFVPAIVEAFAALGFLEGALKYGAFNWRATGVRGSIYFSAALRHMKKWHNGEERDVKTRVPHLASAIACIGIIIDAQLCGALDDDRPPPSPMAKWIDDSEAIIDHLRQLFAGKNPRHWRLSDDQEIRGRALPPARRRGKRA